MSKNDDRIIELKKQVENKKKEIESKKGLTKTFTNCILDLEDKKYNLNVLTEEQLTNLLVRVNMYLMSAHDLGIEKYILSGYSVNSWVTDIKYKMEEKALRREENSLAVMEQTLNKLLSDDKKTELELDSIANMLK